MKRALILCAILIPALFEVSVDSISQEVPPTLLPEEGWVEGKGECSVDNNTGVEEARETALERARIDAISKVMGIKVDVERGFILVETKKGVEKCLISIGMSKLCGKIVEEGKPTYKLLGKGEQLTPLYSVTLKANVVKGAKEAKSDSILRGLANAIWRPYSPVIATLASLTVPGSGQLLNKRKISGYSFLGIGLLSASTAILAQLDLRRALDEQHSALKKSEYVRLGETVKQKRKNRNVVLGVAGAIWLVNSIDTYLESREEYQKYKRIVRMLGENLVEAKVVAEDGTFVRFRSEYDYK